MRYAIITGGSRGLGSALALQLVEKGYGVVDLSRSAPHSFSSRIDLEDPLRAEKDAHKSMSFLSPELCSELLIFSNAGTLAPIGPAWRKPTGEVLGNLNVNLCSAIVVINEAIRHFRSATCRKIIVNISSGAALKGYAGWSLYCAGKAAMESFVRALAAEEAHEPHPFLAISVDPGVIDTDMQAAIREAPATEFPEVGRFITRKKDGALLPPEKVAAAILGIISQPGLTNGGRYNALAEG